MLTYEPKGAKWNKTVKLFDKYGFTVKLDKKTSGDLAKMLESGAKRRGKRFERGAAAYLITCVGSDLNTLLNETEKVCAYAEGSEITRSDIDAVCVKSLDAKVFDMIRDLTAGRFDSAFTKLSVLFEQREDEFQILGALIASYSDIYRAKRLSRRAAEQRMWQNITAMRAENSASPTLRGTAQSSRLRAWATALRYLRRRIRR